MRRLIDVFVLYDIAAR